jgi:hypothetical protein
MDETESIPLYLDDKYLHNSYSRSFVWIFLCSTVPLIGSGCSWIATIAVEERAG